MAGDWNPIDLFNAMASSPPIGGLKIQSVTPFKLAIGGSALDLATGTNNLAIGYQAGALQTTPNSNTFIGNQAASILTVTGGSNVAVGFQAFLGLQGSTQSVAVGAAAMGAGRGVTSAAIGNVAIGFNAMGNITSGTQTVAIGWNALANAVYTGVGDICIGSLAGAALSSSSDNILIGRNCGQSLGASAIGNIGIGTNALTSSTQATAGQPNIAIGVGACQALTAGLQNTAIGYFALHAATTASGCIAIGPQALASYVNADTTYNCNSIAIGLSALGLFTGAVGLSEHCALGTSALGVMTTGVWCNAFGIQALQAATTPVGYNNAFGTSCLGGLTTGSYNTAIGHGSGFAVGVIGQGSTNQLTIGQYCTFIGLQCGYGNTSQNSYVSVLGASAYSAIVGNSVTLGRIGTDIVYAGVTVLGPNASTVGAAGSANTAYTVSTLPAPSAALQGARAFVTDASLTTASVGAALAGSGANVMPVFCNGAAWVYG